MSSAWFLKNVKLFEMSTCIWHAEWPREIIFLKRNLPQTQWLWRLYLILYKLGCMFICSNNTAFTLLFPILVSFSAYPFLNKIINISHYNCRSIAPVSHDLFADVIGKPIVQWLDLIYLVPHFCMNKTKKLYCAKQNKLGYWSDKCIHCLVFLQTSRCFYMTLYKYLRHIWRLQNVKK